MAQLRFKTSSDPIQNFLWGLKHAAYFAAFLLTVFLLNRLGAMPTTYAIFKAVLILGLLVNFLYFCGYIVIASVKYLGNAQANRKN